MKYITNLISDYSGRLAVSGGKGANLHKLIRLGFRVPEGFVINTKAFDEFLRLNNLHILIKSELLSVRVDNHDTITQASKKINREILRAEIPKEILSEMKNVLSGYSNSTFAVRSSGVFEDSRDNSWAGQFDSFLNISRHDLALNVKRCWGSLFNPRAISYNISAYKKLSKLKFAVIIQRMLASDKSGIAFSIDPHENDPEKVLIEATPGFGSNLVSGRVAPLTIVLDKKQRMIMNKSFATSEQSGLLSLKEIKLLCDQIITLEKKFKVPVDIEWSFERKKLYFLQVRPITRLRNREYRHRIVKYPDIRDYELTFKVTGLSFLFADMLSQGFKYLDPLFTSYESQFSQYFSNEKMEYAAKYGMEWLSKPRGFQSYEEEFTEFYQNNLGMLEATVREKLTKASCRRFFRVLSKIFTYYSKTDNEFTNLTYIYSEENPTIRKNLHLLSKFKDYARAWINYSAIEDGGPFSEFIDQVSKQFTIPRMDVECYKVSEIAQLFDGKTLTQNEVRSRHESYTMFFSGSKQVYLAGKESVGFIKRVSELEDLAESSEIKGQVAHRAQKIVRGKVRVINVDYGNLDKVNEQIAQMAKGEILVAEFTAPETLAACRKAKAIVTDIGGMLSHAAIVSRELNIPCLVGTKNATKILKTGDEITINFDLGVVNKTKANHGFHEKHLSKNKVLN
jgi:phosphohistidine swiveling domain-containing protein